MKILLTGSTGFLGGRVKQHLEKLHDVVCLNSDIRGTLVFPYEFDAIVHTVGLNDHQCQENPLKAYDVSVMGTYNLLQSVRAKKVIYFSTIHVYGYPAEGTITEKSEVKAKSVYAVSHYLAEQLVLKHPAGTVIRLSNGWGCPENVSRETAWIVVMNAICKKAIKEKEIELFVGPEEERNFVTASDICGAVSHLLGPHKGVFNVGGTQSVRIIDMAFRVADRCKVLFGYEPKVKTINSGSWEFYEPKQRPPLDNHLLDYRIDKLASTGFRLMENIDQEIDNTLRMVKNEEEKIREHQEVHESQKQRDRESLYSGNKTLSRVVGRFT